MLNKLRVGAKSTVLKLTLFGLLLMAMAGLALMDVQGMFRGGISNTTVASYKGGKITSIEFDRMVQNTLRNQGIKQSDAYRAGLPMQILRQEMDSRMFFMAADDLGLQINDEIVAWQVRDLIAPLVEKGMSKKDAFNRLLQAYGMNEAQLVGTMKSQIATQQLLTTVITGAHAPRQMITDILKFRNEQRKGEYFRLTAEDVGAASKPSDADLKAYYDSVSRDYDLPEYRTLSVIVLDKKALGSDVKISEEKLKEYYDDNIAEFKSPETRVISQAVAPDEETAKKIYAAAQKDKNLQKAATAAKASYVKPGTFSESNIPVEFVKAAFKGDAGAVLEPLQSPLGWHVLYIEKINAATTKPFASVKADIEKELSSDHASEALYERANKIDDEIAGGKPLSEVAKENKVAEITLAKIDERGMDASGKKVSASVPILDKVIQNGFSLRKDGASPLIETPEGSFVIVSAKEIFPAEKQSFDKVRDKIMARWTAEHEAKKVTELANKIMDRIKGGEDFGKIAVSFKKTAQQTAMTPRSALEKAGAEKAMLSALFSLDKPGQAAAVGDNGNMIIVHLTERSVPPMVALSKAETDKLEQGLQQDMQQDILEQYRSSLLTKYKVRVNEKLVEDMYTAKDEAETSGGEEE